MKTIYLLDDDSLVHTLVGRLLKKEYSVECFESIDELLQATEKKLPHLFIIDYFLKGETGIDFLKERINNERIKNTPVIFLSANDSKKTITRVLTFDVYDYLVKPINAISLKNVLAKVFENHIPVEKDISAYSTQELTVNGELTHISEGSAKSFR